MAGAIIYEAPAACPPVAEVRAMADGYLPGEAEAVLRVAHRGGDGAAFAGVVALAPGGFRRALEGDDCAALVRALLLSASLSLHADEDASRAATQRPAASLPPTETPLAPPPPPRATVWLGAEVGVRSVVGPPVVPAAAVAVGIGFAGAPEPLVRLAAVRTLVASIERTGGRTETVLTAARVDACPFELRLSVGGAPASLAACGVVELGVVEAGVQGPAAHPAAARPWLTAGLGLRPSVVVSPTLAIELFSWSFVPILRDRFVTAAETFAAPSPGAAAALGMRGRFW